MRCVGRRGEESKEIHGGRMGRSLDFEVKGRKGFLKRTWKKVVEEESVKVGLRRKDALCRSKWSDGVNQISAGLK